MSYHLKHSAQSGGKTGVRNGPEYADRLKDECCVIRNTIKGDDTFENLTCTID